ncbi:DEAD/DEAH box helicase [bacterium]|nr:DEAD/DEAH box helicase [bacterium]
MEQRAGTEHAYIHQSEAIEELLSPTARPVVVTTGTGSGKTEAFLLPVIQNAWEDATRFRKSGLTAILVYPMNALANDQRQRIEDYLETAGFAGAIRVEQYDRGTPQAKRKEMRDNPPHILLTNYMMLEYLLVRPSDREAIFANHRCRFLVLDEVHTYRGNLGSNVALLVRRLRAHLARARQDWGAEVSAADRPRRFPTLVPVGTSATIRSLVEDDLPEAEIRSRRDVAVQGFFNTLTGAPESDIRVFGEQLQDIAIPPEAQYPATPPDVDLEPVDLGDSAAVGRAICRLAGIPETTPLSDAVRQCRLIWDLHRWLVRRPMPASELMACLRSEVGSRSTVADDSLCREVEAGLVLGAALPEGTPGALRLRAHRFIRGGWKFHRCINPECGRLYPRGEERCTECNSATAPLYLCRNCGAHYLRFVGDPGAGLRGEADESQGPEWMLYEPGRFEEGWAEEEEVEEDAQAPEAGPPTRRGRRGPQRRPTQMGGRPVMTGSFAPAASVFSADPNDYPLNVILAPGRTRCLCCGGTAGSRNVITSVSLGTSAAVKVVGEGLVEALAEANRDRPGHDGKERLLIFSDSRQDAAHQARFIIFASRYDRMRRRLYRLLLEHQRLSIQRAVELLGQAAIDGRDSPYLPENTRWIPTEALERIRAFEEAPLLDDISVNAGYRSTVLNLGLVGIGYDRLDEYVNACGGELAERLGVTSEDLFYICRVLLDAMRSRGAFSRVMLQYDPRSSECPDFVGAAQWERRIKQPHGYPLDRDQSVLPYIDRAEIPAGIGCSNAWRAPGRGGRPPHLEVALRNLLRRLGGIDPDENTMVAILEFLQHGNFLVASRLYGSRQNTHLLQVNAEATFLCLLDDSSRLRCGVCGHAAAMARAELPCPRCHGTLEQWSSGDVRHHRSVERILMPEAIPLVAGEHTAQITTDVRSKLEDDFKAPAGESPTNVLACSPTLEMGIDVGGLDAVVMRNVPPRPDNYAQRGGRAGRRARVGLVLGYARRTPHDQYFYERPAEMIAGEVPAPIVSLANRDVIARHLNAIVLGAAEPGLAGRMVEYISPTGEINQERVDELIAAVERQVDHALTVAHEAWDADVLNTTGLDDCFLRANLTNLPGRIRDVFSRTSRQVIELRHALDHYAQSLMNRHAGTSAGDLVARLLGIPTSRRGEGNDADDRSAGYPLRRFAEFGLLPGYEFPSEPATLRLLRDAHEEDPVSTIRRFGIGQFQPDALVYARGRRWRVIGLDRASPWNPRTEGPSWTYRVCTICDLRYAADQPRCPRCSTSGPAQGCPAYEFAGFVAKHEEQPILDEEDRFAMRNLVKIHPQWDGVVHGRWRFPNGWALRLSSMEEVRWLNESLPPTDAELDSGQPMLHMGARGFLLCPECGRKLDPPVPIDNQRGGRRNPQAGAQDQNGNGHAPDCPRRGTSPRPFAIVAAAQVEVLRLLLPVPATERTDQWTSWGLSLGYALLNGIRLHFMLDERELEFELEGPWVSTVREDQCNLLCVTFVDPNLGGSGYLERIAQQFNDVARSTLVHLDHRDCETACYRCLKAYGNQRYHDMLSWPQIIPALDELAQAAPGPAPLETGDLDDPAPWLEAYHAGVGSPLELRFLRLFEQHGFHPQKQVPVAARDGEAPISVADFAVPERRLAIYVDGAAFHRGPNLRRDRFIRRRLREGNPPWRVEELRADDLRDGADLVLRLLE